MTRKSRLIAILLLPLFAQAALAGNEKTCRISQPDGPTKNEVTKRWDDDHKYDLFVRANGTRKDVTYRGDIVRISTVDTASLARDISSPRTDIAALTLDARLVIWDTAISFDTVNLNIVANELIVNEGAALRLSQPNGSKVKISVKKATFSPGLRRFLNFFAADASGPEFFRVFADQAYIGAKAITQDDLVSFFRRSTLDGIDPDVTISNLPLSAKLGKLATLDLKASLLNSLWTGIFQREDCSNACD
jgi:hypothetical protein